MATDEIRVVHLFSRDNDGTWTIMCSHCGRVMGVVEGDDGTPRGEQYIDVVCGGWTEVDHDASYRRELQ